MICCDHIQNDCYYNVIFDYSMRYFEGDTSALNDFMSSFYRWYLLDYQLYREMCLLVISYFEGVSYVSS